MMSKSEPSVPSTSLVLSCSGISVSGHFSWPPSAIFSRGCGLMSLPAWVLMFFDVEPGEPGLPELPPLDEEEPQALSPSARAVAAASAARWVLDLEVVIVLISFVRVWGAG